MNHKTNTLCFFLFILCPLLLLSYFSFLIPFDLGTFFYPAPLYGEYIRLYFASGSLALILFSFFLTLRDKKSFFYDKIIHHIVIINDKRWVIYISLLAIITPILIRLFILKGAPISDDEFAYQLSAELLLDGKLYSESKGVFKAFFDHPFIFNDTKMYSQYFLGWPALMMPGLILKLPGFINALYSGLTVPALFFVSKKLTNSRWAKLTTLIYLTSPMLMIAAATKMAHTSELMMLAWMFWFFLKTLSIEKNKVSDHFFFSLFFAIAFFIRPQAALPLSIPYLIVWFCKIFSHKSALLKFLAFIVPALSMAFLFLYVNKAQTGNYFTPAYATVAEYRKTQLIYPIKPKYQGLKYNIDLNINRSVHETLAAFIRLNFAAFGWPISFLFILFASWRNYAWTVWSGIISFFIIQMIGFDPGIDTFGPTHYFETLLPILLLTAIGGENLTKICREKGFDLNVFAIIIFCIMLSLLFYTPKRLSALYRIQKDVNYIPNKINELGIKNAVVFLEQKAFLYCKNYPTRHFRYWQVDYDYTLRQDVLYLHHINIKLDVLLVNKLFPKRQGYFLVESPRCKPKLIKLEG